MRSEKKTETARAQGAGTARKQRTIQRGIEARDARKPAKKATRKSTRKRR